MKSLNNRAIALLSIFIWIMSAVSVSAQQPWVNMQSPVTSDLTSVSFPDSENGYITTRDGQVLCTRNGGLDWEIISEVPYTSPSRMHFIDAGEGWMVGNSNNIIDSAAIFHTTDSGQTWQTQFYHAHYQFHDIHFRNDTLGWLAGYEVSESDTLSLTMYTTTSGFSWTTPFGPRIQNMLFSIDFMDEQNGFACGQSGIFFETHNGGMDLSVGWGTNLSIPGYHKDLYHIASSGANYGCAVGEDGIMIVTKNKWTAHQDHYNDEGDQLNSITAYNAVPQFYAVGNNGCVASIRYALFFWSISEETRVTSNNLNDVCQVDDQYIWAVGDHGTILFHSNNYPPIAVDDEGSVRQDSSLQIHVLDNDMDMDFDPLEIYDYNDGKHGVLVQAENSDYLEFFPDDDYVGMDTAQYVVTDNKLGFDTANIFIEIREAPAGPFTRLEITHDTLAFGSAIWGDIDNDDDYDIVVCGMQADGSKHSTVFYNEEGSFERSPDNLEGLRPGNDGAMAFTDLNMDGYLDFIATGEDNGGIPRCQLYIYDPIQLSFESYTTNIPGVVNGSVDWGDYDQDGDPDLLLTGYNGSEKICELYRNDGQSDERATWDLVFTSSFVGLDHGAARFVDFNHDLYIDVISTGSDAAGDAKTYYYTNLYGQLIRGELEGYKNSTLDFCDFNADGSWDILLTGTRADKEPHAGMLTYTDDFNELASSLTGVSSGSASWGDFDNDGDPDLVVCGMNDQLAPVTQLYINNAGELEKSDYFLPGMASGTLEWGDFDADGDLDLLMSGYFNTEPNRITTILRNDLNIANEAPEAPDQLSAEREGGLSIKWSPGSDEESPVVSLAYNFMLRSKKTNNIRIKPASNDSLILEIPGYASVHDTVVLIKGLNQGALYECEIQTVDASFHVSPWKKFQFNAPSNFLWEQDVEIKATEIRAAEWFYRENESEPVLLLTDYMDSAATLVQWTGLEFDTVARYPGLGSGHGQVALLDFNMDNEVDFSEFDIADSSMVVYISSGDTLRFHTSMPRACYDWGDYDRDGDPDLVISGPITDDFHYASIYRNDGGNMVELDTPIPGVMDGDIAWVDIDGDGDEDVAVTGRNKDLGFITRIYENRDGGLLEKQTDLPGLWYSSFDFADYDCDGDLDMLLCGREENEPMTMIYVNSGGEFVPTSYGLAPNERGSCKWVDLYRDGQFDIVLLGYPKSDMVSSRKTATVYLYENGKYNERAKIEGVPGPYIAAGDYDDNGMVDLAFAGSSGERSKVFIYWNNNEAGSYWSAGSPRNLSVAAYGDSVLLTWDYPEDIDPTKETVTYNLRVGTSSGANDILSPLADESGSRKVIQPGNITTGTSRTLHGLSPDSTYYAAVQTVDPAFYGSAFTDEISFNTLSGTMIPGEVIFSEGFQARNAVWADLDSDGDPDLLMKLGNSIVWYENNDGIMDFENYTHLVDGSFTDDLLLTDPDKDNDVDILLLSSDNVSANKVLENTSGIFTVYDADVGGLYNADVALGDLNNDGNTDMVIMGTEEPDASIKAMIYRLNDDGYESLDNTLIPAYNGEIHLVDLLCDGDLDLIRCGITEVNSEDPKDVQFLIDKNVNNGAFVNQETFISGLKYCNLAFGDYDSDGDLDFLYSGTNPWTGMPKTYICKNFGGGFSRVDSSLVQVTNASAKWFDYNNDGLLDIVISGYNDTDDHADDPDARKFSGIYLNMDGSFELAARLQDFVRPLIAVADVDMDGRQDIFLAGLSTIGDTLGILYRNVTPEISTPSYVPTLNVPTEDEKGVHFTWIRRPLAPDTYNMRIGTKPGTGDVLSPLSHADGTRKVYDNGNIQTIRYTMHDLDPGTTYYAALQAISPALVPSAWSNEVQFTTLGTGVLPAAAPPLDVNIYPIPAREQLHVDVRSEHPGEVCLEVIDQLGRTLFRKTEMGDGGMISFRISLPESGLYLLRIRSGPNQVIRKVVMMD